jgi:hypothetical protein
VAIARGGLQFMLIIWLQGIWLPLHGYDYSQTPLWAGIFLLPLTAGFLVSGPVAGFLSDAVAHQIATLPPVSSLFAAVLGVNPLGHLLAAHGGLATLPAAARQTLTGREFFPSLISGPFQHGLIVVFAFATVLSALAALASALRGARPGQAPAGPD